MQQAIVLVFTTQYSTFSTEHSRLSTRYSVLSIQYSQMYVHLGIANFGTTPAGLFTCQLGLLEVGRRVLWGRGVMNALSTGN